MSNITRSKNRELQDTLGPSFRVSDDIEIPPYRTMILMNKFSWKTMSFWNEVAWILSDCECSEKYDENTILTKSESIAIELSKLVGNYKIVVV